jgi:hypothetical protein
MTHLTALHHLNRKVPLRFPGSTRDIDAYIGPYGDQLLLVCGALQQIIAPDSASCSGPQYRDARHIISEMTSEVKGSTIR